MSIGTGLAIASSGLTAIDKQLALVSQNIANANTPSYSVESATLSTSTAGGQGSGVISGPATHQVSTSIQAQLSGSLAQQSYQNAISSALSNIDQVMGSPGTGNDLPSQLGKVQSSFQTLLTDPSNPVQQGAVVDAAQTLTRQINGIAGTLQSVSQNTTSTVTAGIRTLNTTLANIGSLNNQIIALATQGKGTADLANQRDAAVQTAISLTGAKAIAQSDGAIVLFSPNGIQLPLNGGSTVSASMTGSGTSFQTGGSGLIFGGALGGAQHVLNNLMPQIKAGLDSFSEALATRFAGAGLSLFTDPSGGVPTTLTPGLSSTLTVNPAVLATPSLVRDGNLPVTTASGSTVSPNPPSGPAGYTTVIQNVLQAAFGTTTTAGSPQPAAISVYTDSNGSASLPYPGSGTLLTIATNFTANEASLSGNAQSASTNAGNLVTALQTQASSISGVSIDKQMARLVTLQNAYAANAKTVSVAQQLWQATEAMIQ